MSGSVKSKRTSEAGVSLLEVLIALAIMALIAYLISPLLSSSTRALLISSDIEENATMAFSRYELKVWLESAIANSSDDAGAKNVSFQGFSDQIHFEMVEDNGFFWPGLNVSVSISAQGENGNERVVAVANGYSQNEVVQQKKLTLSSVAGTIEFEYFGRLNDMNEESWSSSWTDQNSLPELVRIWVKDKNTEFPPLVISVGTVFSQNEMSLSSLVPPAIPSRP